MLGAFLPEAFLLEAILPGAFLPKPFLLGALLPGAFLPEAFLLGAFLPGAFLLVSLFVVWPSGPTPIFWLFLGFLFPLVSMLNHVYSI